MALCRRIQFFYGNCSEEDMRTFDCTSKTANVTDSANVTVPNFIYIDHKNPLFPAFIVILIIVIIVQVMAVFYAKRKMKMTNRNGVV